MPHGFQAFSFRHLKLHPRSLIVLSRDADANSLPSGENVMTLAQPLWSSSLIYRLASIIASHSLIVLSLDADANIFPSGRWVDPNNAFTILEYHPRTVTAGTTSRPRREKQENARDTTKTKISEAAQGKLTGYYPKVVGNKMYMRSNLNLTTVRSV
jgi:hypothetical protein